MQSLPGLETASSPGLNALPPLLFIYIAITITIELSLRLLLLLSLLLLLLLLLLLFELLIMLMISWTLRMTLDIIPNTPISARFPTLPQKLSPLPELTSTLDILLLRCLYVARNVYRIVKSQFKHLQFFAASQVKP